MSKMDAEKTTMDNWRCKYCGYRITMPCQRPECVEARKVERASGGES